MSSNDLVLVETSQTIIGPKEDVTSFFVHFGSIMYDIKLESGMLRTLIVFNIFHH